MRGLALHHTAGRLAGTALAPAELRGVQRFHQQSKGWVDIAYHVFVDADGAAWAGRDLRFAGDTATDYDPAGWLLVCALGNFETTAPPPALLAGLARVLGALSERYGLPLADLQPHRALAATLCPGKHLVEALDGLRQRGG